MSKLPDFEGLAMFAKVAEERSYAGAAERAVRISAKAEEIECVALETARRPRGLLRLAVPMSFGTRWVAPILPDFFRHYPDIAVDLHLSDEKIDLIGDGFDAALRVAVLEDSALVAKQLAPVRRFIVAAPS